MKVTKTALEGVLILEPRVFGDERGFFMETFHEEKYREAGVPTSFVQDNFSRSVKGTLRGLHFQEPNAQGKLVQALSGTVLDIIVDVRVGSPTFKKWLAVELSGDAPKQVWVPAGFAHGFCVLSESADFLYKCTALYAPQSERSIRWDDPELAIDWPVREPKLSKKDALAPTLAGAPLLPKY